MLSGGNNLDLVTAVKNQYVYKLRAHSNWFVALILVQVFAALLFSTSVSTGSMCGNVSITFGGFSSQADTIITVLWALIVSLLLTTSHNKSETFTLPGNRLSDNLSDIVFILTVCVFGGVTSALSGVAMRVPVYLFNMGRVMENDFYPVISDICVIAFSTMLYMLLFSAGGYFFGTLVKLNRWLYVIIPAFLFCSMFFINSSSKSRTFLRACVDSITTENSLGNFTVKVVVLSAALLLASVVLSSRMEVRK